MFSKNERKLVKMITKKPITITELTEKYYGDDVPFEGRNRVAGLVNRIAAKLEASDEKWRLASKGGGRAGKSVWRENA